MKAVFKVAGLKTCKDVTRVKNAIANNEGIIACQINKNTCQVEVIYDNYFITEEKLMSDIENLGYTVI